MPKVTVVVPTYRRPQMLAEALGSILHGSFADFEVLVANDGPEDDLEFARAEHPDPRVTWLTRPQRLGMLANHIDAFGRARGEFVTSLDDDDRWAPDMLSTLVPILDDHPDVSVAFADHSVVDAESVVDETLTEANSRRWGRAALAEGPHRPFLRLAVVDRSIPMQCAAVFRRSALDLADYPESVGMCWDVWTAYLLAKRGGTGWYVPKRLAYYRSHPSGSTLASRGPNARAAIYCAERFLDDPELSAWRSDLKAWLAAARIRLAAELLRERHILEGCAQAGRAATTVMSSPLSFKRLAVKRKLAK
jgi:glycosyltransferase involved in cell wall biosynthesis